MVLNMNPQFKQKLTTYFNTLTLPDIYKILESPTILYRTGKNRHPLQIFSSKEAFDKYEIIFLKNLHKIKLKLMIKELTKEGYKIELCKE